MVASGGGSGSDEGDGDDGDDRGSRAALCRCALRCDDDTLFVALPLPDRALGGGKGDTTADDLAVVAMVPGAIVPGIGVPDCPPMV